MDDISARQEYNRLTEERDRELSQVRSQDPVATFGAAVGILVLIAALLYVFGGGLLSLLR